MNKKFTDFGAYRMLEYLGSGDGISSLRHKLDCRIASCDARFSHLGIMRMSTKMIANIIAQIKAVTYVPFGNRGKAYVSRLLDEIGETIESNAKKHALWIARNDNITENDINNINIATQNQNIDFNNLPSPTYKNLPCIIFEFEEMLDEISRCNMWPKDPNLSTKNYILHHIDTYLQESGKIMIPDEILSIFNSEEFKQFECSGLTERERKYLDTYLETVSYFTEIPPSWKKDTPTSKESAVSDSNPTKAEFEKDLSELEKVIDEINEEVSGSAKQEI